MKRQPHWLYCPVSTSRRLPSKKTVRLGDKAKPLVRSMTDGFAVFAKRGSQYKIIKIKFAISMIAVTPATESTKASLASW